MNIRRIFLATVATALSVVLTTTDGFAAEPCQDGVYVIYPVPHRQVAGNGCTSFTPAINIVPENGIDEVTISRAVEIFGRHGITASISDAPVSDSSNLLLGINGSKGVADKFASRYDIPRDVFALQKYDRHVLKLCNNNRQDAQVTVIGENTDAVFCGLASLEQMLDAGVENLPCVTISDYADTKIRGIIEGYYGIPYSAAVTKDLFRFMARYKLNTYMYGAKSDPYHSRYWSEPYPEHITDEQERIGYMSGPMLSDVASAALNSKVSFIWAIHPGKAFADAKAVDVNDRILAKFEDMKELGVTQFGVFVDDVGVPSDTMVLKLCASRLDALQKKVEKPLHYVPQLYAYNSSKPERAAKFFGFLGQVDSRTDIYTTGSAVWSVPNKQDFDNVSGWLGRPVDWWWNYPCNDNDMSKLFTMDMYTNFRDEKWIDSLARMEDLGSSASAILVNPMQQGEVSKISLFSVADYCWNYNAFDVYDSWEASFEAVAGKEYAEALRFLAPFLRWFDKDALGVDVERYKQSVQRGRPSPDALKTKLGKVVSACSKLEQMKDSGDESIALLYTDLRPWLLKLKAMAVETISLLDGNSPSSLDFEKDENFRLEVLHGMGENIRLSTVAAEPSGEVLRPFINWLKKGK